MKNNDSLPLGPPGFIDQSLPVTLTANTIFALLEVVFTYGLTSPVLMNALMFFTSLACIQAPVLTITHPGNPYITAIQNALNTPVTEFGESCTVLDMFNIYHGGCQTTTTCIDPSTGKTADPVIFFSNSANQNNYLHSLYEAVAPFPVCCGSQTNPIRETWKQNLMATISTFKNYTNNPTNIEPLANALLTLAKSTPPTVGDVTSGYPSDMPDGYPNAVFAFIMYSSNATYCTWTSSVSFYELLYNGETDALAAFINPIKGVFNQLLAITNGIEFSIDSKCTHSPDGLSCPWPTS